MSAFFELLQDRRPDPVQGPPEGVRAGAGPFDVPLGPRPPQATALRVNPNELVVRNILARGDLTRRLGGVPITGLSIPTGE